MNMNKLLVSVLWVFLLAGCANTPNVQFYVLESLTLPASPTVSGTKQRTIGIGPVSLPALLERKQIVTRLSDNTVKIAEFEHWASPLQDSLMQVLTHNLSGLQPHHIVRTYPWSVHGTVALQVIVDIIRFDTTPGKSANLEANWTIKNEASHDILKSGRSVIKHPLADTSYPGTIRALSKVLGQFSQELSSDLLQVEAR
jgi:uncharacterized protein